MTLIKERHLIAWDWRYRVGFDNNLSNKVERFYTELYTPHEQGILLSILEVCKHFVSVDALIEESLVNPLRFSEFIENIENGSPDLLWISPAIISLLGPRIRELSKRLNSSELKELRSLIDRAMSGRPSMYSREIHRLAFGSQLDQIIDNARYQHFSPVRKTQREPIRINELNSSVFSFLKATYEDPRLKAMFDGIEIPPFSIDIVEAPGFAEYWPKGLHPRLLSNTLIINVNKDSLDSSMFPATLAHELYPGHALFYAEMARSEAAAVDHGSLGLVEGWATWAEWNGIASTAGMAARQERLDALQFFDDNDEGLEFRLLEFYQARGYARENALQALLYHLQYPGMNHAYTLGGLWFEDYFKEVRPIDFLRGLRYGSWADLFRLW